MHMTEWMRLTLPFFGLAALLVAGDSIPAQQSTFVIDPAKTEVQYTLDSKLHTIHGTFRLKRGDLRFDTATGKASGELLVDAASGDSGSNARDKRMHAHILESADFPQIAFRPDHVEGTLSPNGKSLLQLHGMFLLHGTVHEMTLPLTVDAADGSYTGSTIFEIPYVKWGLKNPSTLFLRVNDTVRISVHTVAHCGS
jgi:polyisoprenoid-binding protein YceI